MILKKRLKGGRKWGISLQKNLFKKTQAASTTNEAACDEHRSRFHFLSDIFRYLSRIAVHLVR